MHEFDKEFLEQIMTEYTEFVMHLVSSIKHIFPELEGWTPVEDHKQASEIIVNQLLPFFILYKDIRQLNQNIIRFSESTELFNNILLEYNKKLNNYTLAIAALTLILTVLTVFQIYTLIWHG